jgi:hypothetical protein
MSEYKESNADSVLVLWRADTPEQAEEARYFVGMNPAGIPDASGIDITEGGQAILSNINFGPLSGCVFIAWGEEGMDEIDRRNIDYFASRIPCETETYIGAAEDFIQTKIIRPPQWRAVA